MNCPICKTTQLLMAIRGNIEIDYCPECRGVWLDRGELDKIIEKSNLPENSAPNTGYLVQPQYPQQIPYAQNIPQSGHHTSKHGSSHSNYHNNSSNNDHYPKKKKGGWLEEILDF